MLEHEKEKKDLPVQKAAEQDNPPYLASLLAYHPGLTSLDFHGLELT